MVCRSTPGNSALTTYARLHSGVDDVQVLSMFHELRNEAPRVATAPSDFEYRHFLDGIRRRVRLDGTLSDARRTSLLNRLTRAETQRPDAATYYAWRTIESRAVRARTAMDAHFTEIAERHGSTAEQVQAAFRRIAEENREAGRNAPRPPARLEYDAAGVPSDRATRYALAVLYEGGPRVATDPAAHQTAREQAEANSAEAAEAEEYAADLANGVYDNQCSNCGQFASDDHVCLTGNSDTLASDEAIDRLAQALQRPTVGDQSIPVPNRTRAVENDNSPASAPAAHAAPQTPYTGFNRSISEARDRIRAENGAFITSDGQRWNNHMAAIRHERDLPADPPQRLLSLTEAVDRLRLISGRYRTTDGRVFPDRLAAIRHERTLSNCPNCGQFSGDGHTCPTPAATETLTDWASRVGAPSVTVTLEEAAAPVDLDSDRDLANRITATPPVRRRQRTPLRNYSSESARVRMTNLSQVRLDARQAGVGNPVTISNTAVTLTVPSADSVYGRGVARVTGSFAVTDNGGRRRGGRDRFVVTEEGERSLRCSCPQYRANYDCPHLRQAREQIQALLNNRDAVAVAPTQAVDEARSALYADYQQSLTSQQQARDVFAGTQSGVSYADDMAAFQRAWDDAKARLESGDHRLPYLTENATGGLGARDGGRSFGVEIEVDFPDDLSFEAKQRVAREMYEAGLSQSPYVQGWRSAARYGGARMGQGYSDAPNRWSVEFDRSVDDVNGQRGCEIVSPIMYDTPETWENLRKVCEIVERHGGRATTRTGLHVNVGAGDYDHTVGNHNRLLRLSEAYEDVIVRCSHNPQAGTAHRGRHYCQPSQVPAAGYRRISDAVSDNGHYSMVNLSHLPAEGQRVTGSTRVEVRIFDGTVDPGRLQTNIKVALGLVAAAHRGEEPGIEPEPAGSHRRNRVVGSSGRARRLSGDAWTQDTASFRKFSDTMFSREEDKKQLVAAFAASRWQAR